MTSATAPEKRRSRNTKGPGRQSRDLRARNRLVRSELDLADRIARDYRNRGIDLDDLRQVAYLALIRAADRYDDGRGTRFAVYASVSINGELKRYFRDHGWGVRPPRSLQERYLTLRSIQDRLSQKLGRTPSVRELADEAEIGVDDVLAAKSAHAGYRSQSIDAPVHDDRSDQRLEPSVVEDGFDDACADVDFERLLEPLTDRQRLVVRLRFCDGLTQAAIAEEIGVSQVQVSRMLSQILDTLRDHVGDLDAA